ncbi:MAG: response regulator [Gammaproteobacteria bacterium]|nr:response regulator [Gammaproteobacteria bacterium]MCW8986282.1 response regulator [Gammaproteobacteria bacterium]
MARSSQSKIEEKLASLQANFKQTLPDKIDKIEQLWNAIISSEANESAVIDCHRMSHTLVGSGGTFGAVVVSSAARELEQALKLIVNKQSNLTSGYKLLVSSLISKLKDIAENWQPSKTPHLQPFTVYETSKGKGNLIYLAEDDELLAQELVTKLGKTGFVIKHFADLDSFSAAVERELPSAVIMDIMFKEGDIAGVDKILKLKQELEVCPPIVFISARNDIEARLAAAKAGAQRYFTKPLDLNKLSQTLDGLVERTVTKPFRALLVDDDVSLLNYYETVLNGAGMEVKTLSNPLKCLAALDEFKPDVIVLDVYMPECTGPELAQVIRQDDNWSITPIMFLSTETDLDVQLDAMNLGGESFLTKPITAKHLISVVTSKAKHSRWNHRITDDLKMAVREGEFQLITSNQHDIVSTADVSGRIISVNEKFCEISGYSREELLGKNHRLLKSKRHPDSFYEEMWNTISNGEVWHGTICNLNKDQEEYWVDSTIVPFLDEKGKPYKYVSARTDVTFVLQSEERLERSQEFANIGTWDWNIETGGLFWSDRIWPLFGYEKEVTDTTYDNFMAAIHPDDQQRVADAVARCVEHEEDYDIEHRVVWPDGSIHWLHESGDVVRSAKGAPLHMLGVVQDVTARKEAEYAFIIAREDAETANRAKSQFLSSMSHELRTPMNAIMGFGQLLNMEIDRPLSASQQENVAEILKASDHLLELINEVLDLAKIEAGRIDLSIEDVLLGNVLVESLQLILPLAQRRGIEIEIFRSGAEVSINDLIHDTNVVRADTTRTKQVIINLLSNAVKYNAENGKIVINCERSNNHFMRISITDTGAGLDKEQQDQLFTAFNRLGQENTSVEGTGIGLVITQHLVELMGGQINVDSSVGEGSTFWFELPLGSEQLVDSYKAEVTEVVDIDLEDGRSVLYVEDNPANLRLVTQLLSRLPNLHMWSAHEPLLGLDLAITNKPDLILLDINLPGIDGFELLKLLKQQNETREIPVIAISANTMPRDIERGFEAGFIDYITKPIDINKLLVAVDANLKR